MKIRIGTVPYLNEKPLTRWFHATPQGRASGIEVIPAVPSALARMLAEGEITAALVSSFEYFRTPGYAIVPGISISGQDHIESVRAFSRLRWNETQSLALDTSSLTSSALLKITLAETEDAHPAYIHHAPDLSGMLRVADAALLIGDKGWLADGTSLYTLDLGHAWRRLAGLPFVYAVWLARPEDITPHLADTLNQAKEWGLSQFDAIAEEEAERLDCPSSRCLHYLTDIMDYDLGEEHLRALETFGRKARTHGLLPLLTQ